MIEIILWLIFAYFGWYYLLEYLEKRRSPPGPIPIPILGNLIQVALAGETPSLGFHNLAKKYGEIFQLRVGLKTVVVLASYEAITTIFNLPESYGRDHSGSWHDRNFQKNLGIGFGDGPLWEKTKQWTIRNLRDFGFGKSASMESSIHKELKTFFDKVDKSRAKDNNVIKVTGLFDVSVIKILWQMMVGHCTDEDMKVISILLAKSAEMVRKGTVGASLITAFPFIRFLIPEVTGHNAQMGFYKEAHVIARGLLSKSRKKIENKSEGGLVSLKPENLVEAFVYKAQEDEGNSDTIFTDENFIVIFMDLFQAGAETTSSFLEAFLLFMILYPDVQSKVVDEIHQFEREGEDFALANKEKMIYTQATMWEVHRHTKVSQNFLPRRVLQDFNYKNYLIKKDTLLIANPHSVCFDEGLWDDPTAFRPERFIENGQLGKLNCLMSFGVGKRICPGEVLAQATSFLFVTFILQKYKLTSVPRHCLPSQTMNEGLTSKPFPFELVLTTDRN